MAKLFDVSATVTEIWLALEHEPTAATGGRTYVPTASAFLCEPCFIWDKRR
jgi:hypothetical protein